MDSKAQIELVITNLKSYRILFYILCKRRLSDPITHDDQKEMRTKLTIRDNPILSTALSLLRDDNIDKILCQSEYEKVLFDALNRIGYTSYVNLYTDDEKVSSFFDNYSILYVAITHSYDKNICELIRADIFDPILFSFCLLKYYVVNNHIFNFDIYTSVNIILKLLKLRVKRNDIFSQIDRKKNYRYLFDNFISIMKMNKNGDTLHLFKYILSDLNKVFNERNFQRFNNGSELTLVQQRKYTLILYLMGIDLLKDFMEPLDLIDIESGDDKDKDKMDIVDDKDIEAEEVLKNLEQLSSEQLESMSPDQFIQFTSIGCTGIAGGRRRRKIRRLKSYK